MNMFLRMHNTYPLDSLNMLCCFSVNTYPQDKNMYLQHSWSRWMIDSCCIQLRTMLRNMFPMSLNYALQIRYMPMMMLNRSNWLLFCDMFGYMPGWFRLHVLWSWCHLDMYWLMLSVCHCTQMSLLYKMCMMPRPPNYTNQPDRLSDLSRPPDCNNPRLFGYKRAPSYNQHHFDTMFAPMIAILV